MNFSKNSEERVLVIGGSGRIGRLAIESLIRKTAMTATTRNRVGIFEADAPCRWFELDISDENSISRAESFGKFTAIFNCSGIAERAKCDADPSGTRSINVDGVVKALEVLAGPDTWIANCSTDLVAAAPSGFGEYEKQKTDLELRLSARFPRVLHLRLGKLLDSRFIGLQWRENLSRGESLQVFSERFFSPVLEKDVGDVFSASLDAKPTGTILVSASDEWSYLKFANWLVDSNEAAKLTGKNFYRTRPAEAVMRGLNVLSRSTQNALEIFFR